MIIPAIDDVKYDGDYIIDIFKNILMNVRIKNMRTTTAKKYGNKTITCKCISIDNRVCDFNTELFISDQMISRITLFDVTRNCFESVKEKDSVVLCLKNEDEYITVINSYLSNSIFRHCERESEGETGITLEYVSSKLLYGLDARQGEMLFDSFVFEITDGIEMIGEWPFTNDIEGDERCMTITSIGKLIFKEAALGFSYFVIPYIEKSKQELVLKCQYKIRYQNDKLFEIFQIESIIRQVVLFFEILCGETVSINELEVNCKDGTAEYIGINNFLKDKLNGLENGFDTTSYLRKSIFKLSDFGDSLEIATQKFRELHKENFFAYESYKQVLLDEEVEIITYNKFLKVMQIVEGYQRAQEDDKAIVEFNNNKQEIIGKLEDVKDIEFISKYTNYNGETFRKCLNNFTYDAIKIISGLSKTKAKEYGDKLIGKILNDRDVYTHASKKREPCLNFDEIGYVITCYKNFFRILNLHKFGLSEEIVRKRLLFNRKFVDNYEQLFGLKIKIENNDTNTGDFDQKMWGYDS